MSAPPPQIQPSEQVAAYYRLVDNATRINPGSGTFETNPTNIAQMSKIFTREGVYERAGWPEPFVGQDAIQNFLTDQRVLVGTHSIKQIHATPGIHPQVEAGIQQHFSNLNPGICHTVEVRGEFIGAQCAVEGKNSARFVKAAAGVPLEFHDYWVVAKGKVLYRYSSINERHTDKPLGNERY